MSVEESDWHKELKETKSALDKVSSSMCLAKWLQVTLHLQNGTNHSCHHNAVHKSNLKELERRPSELHNTTHKKEQRKKMLKGERPEECHYCWKAEDTGTEAYSDRIIKSNDSWAKKHFKEVKELPWDSDINPTYVEVSFGNLCNFACAYCLPNISSKVFADLRKFGPYPVRESYDQSALDYLEKDLCKSEDDNPYIAAFWKWFPTIVDGLHVFRITGGEPLIHRNTFKVLDYFFENPQPKLELSVNSNFGIPNSKFLEYLKKSKELLDTKSIRRIQTFTSVDTFGAQAEYIRDGLNYKELMDNIVSYLKYDKNFYLTIMVTFNVLALPQFIKFLENIRSLRQDLLGQKVEGCSSRFLLDISTLSFPSYLNALILPKSYRHYLVSALEYMEAHSDSNEAAGFMKYEILKMKRLLDWFDFHHLKDDDLNRNRAEFFNYIKNYDQRRHKNFLVDFPEYQSFYDDCKNLSESMANSN